VVRKVAMQVPAQRRTGVNRAQLKALAAQQAMSSAAARPDARVMGVSEASDGPGPMLDIAGLAPARRRYVLSREQEFAYIRADIVRLLIISGLLLAVLVVTLLLLR